MATLFDRLKKKEEENKVVKGTTTLFDKIQSKNVPAVTPQDFYQMDRSIKTGPVVAAPVKAPVDNTTIAYNQKAPVNGIYTAPAFKPVAGSSDAKSTVVDLGKSVAKGFNNSMGGLFTGIDKLSYSPAEMINAGTDAANKSLGNLGVSTKIPKIPDLGEAIAKLAYDEANKYNVNQSGNTVKDFASQTLEAAGGMIPSILTGSMLSSGATTAVPIVKSILGTLPMGLSKGGGTSKQIADQGGSYTQQIAGLISTGFNEMVTELLPFDEATKLVKSVAADGLIKNGLKNLISYGKSTLMEGLQEVAVSPMDTMAMNEIMGANDEAFNLNQAKGDFLGGVALSVLLAGLGVGGGASYRLATDMINSKKPITPSAIKTISEYIEKETGVNVLSDIQEIESKTANPVVAKQESVDLGAIPSPEELDAILRQDSAVTPPAVNVETNQQVKAPEAIKLPSPAELGISIGAEPTIKSPTEAIEPQKQQSVTIPRPNPDGSLKTDDINPDNISVPKANAEPEYNDYKNAVSDINSKSWYHGSGTAGLTPERLTSTQTEIEGLFGHGVYLTDNKDIASEYANSRSKRTKTPVVYQAEIDMNNVIDMETKMPDDAYEIIKRNSNDFLADYENGFLDEVQQAHDNGASGKEIWKMIMDEMSIISSQEMISKSEFYDIFQEMTGELKDAGYDGFTHLGGTVTGGKKHQVVIAFDPNNEFGSSGRKSNFKSFSDSDTTKKSNSTDDGIVRRTEEPGVTRADFTKPHGIYTTPSSVKNSPHAALGGETFYWKKNPDAKVLELITDVFRTNRGLVGESAGIAAARKFLGDEEVTRMTTLGKKALASELSADYPDVEWGRYDDQHEMMEAVGAILARENGYDAINAIDKYDPNDDTNEFVGLNENSMSVISTPGSNKPVDNVKPQEYNKVKEDVKKPSVVRKIGRAGNKVFNKWAQNERFMIDIGSGSKDEQAFKHFFDTYYWAGYDGEDLKDYSVFKRLEEETLNDAVVLSNTSWLKDEFYNAGIKDGETAANKSSKSETTDKDEKKPEIEVKVEALDDKLNQVLDLLKNNKDGEKNVERLLEEQDIVLPSGSETETLQGAEEGKGTGEQTDGPGYDSTGDRTGTVADDTGKKSDNEILGETERPIDAEGNPGVSILDSEYIAGNNLGSNAVENLADQNDMNFRFEDTSIDESKPNYNKNIAAIKTLKKLIVEKRIATAEEMKILSAYKGWGGLKSTFVETKGYNWMMRDLQNLLTAEEFESAKSSMRNAHYTSLEIVAEIYTGLQAMGFNGGKILEPSMGTGNFFGMLPESISKRSKLYGVELDGLTGSIAKQLYPQADIRISGFQDVEYKDNFFDAAVGNVPFGETILNYKNRSYKLHDYFFIKSLDKVKEGGVVAFITSTGTLDKLSSKMRKEVMGKADLVAAFRLPNTAFESANTEVTTDIIILRKREEGRPYAGEDFEAIGNIGDIPVNEYFVNHPEHLLGKLTYEKNMYAKERAQLANDGRDLIADLNALMGSLPRVYSGRKGSEVKVDKGDIENTFGYKKYSYVDHNGKLYYVGKEVLAPVKNNENKIRNYMAVKEAFLSLIEGSNNVSDGRSKLNEHYDNFVKQYGPIGSINNKVLKEDVEYPKVAGIESYNYDTKKFEKSEIFTKDTNVKKRVESVNSAYDALIVSLNESAKVDMKRMAEISGISIVNLAEELSDHIIMGNDGDYQLIDVYLSGNIREKLRQAKKLSESNKSYIRNVELLESAMPMEKQADEISPQLGSPWISIDYIKAFCNSLGVNTRDAKFNITYEPSKGTWGVYVPGVKYNGETVNFSNDYISFYKLLENTLNMKTVTIYEKDSDGSRYVNTKATEDARLKAKLLKDRFEEWIFQDAKRRDDLVRTFNERFNSHKLMDFEKVSKYLIMEDVKNIELRTHQKKAVSRILFGGDTLLAHGVGAGKTFVMIGASHELIRTGASNKNIMVVPNHKISDFENDYRLMYPDAKILVASEGDLKPENRVKFFTRIASNNWECVIIPHSSFGLLPISPERQAMYIEEEIAELSRVLEDLKDQSDGKKDTRFIKNLLNTLDNKREQLKLLLNTPKDDSIYFDKMGIGALFVDEAHNFKNLSFYTKLNVPNVKTTAAKRAEGMYLKAGTVREQGGRVIFATATPITNSVAEMYNMTRFVNPSVLKDAGIESFDAWAATFGQIEMKMEMGTDSKSFRAKERFVKYKNIQSMIGMFRQFADVIRTKDVIDTLPNAEKIDVVSDPNPYLEAFLDDITERINDIKSKGSDKSDNMLLITSDGRAAATDLRLVSGLIGETSANLDMEGSKINKAVKNIYKEYKGSKARKGTQIVFLDFGIRAGDGRYSFSLYDDLIAKLVKMGIPRNEIATIHQATNDKQKETLFNDVNKGKVRVLIGSTAKMGEGMNVQERSVALHHLNAPYRPSDIEQREGRIIRQGNKNKDVRIYSYIQEKSFDSYMWQMLSRKGEFINQAMSGNVIGNEMDEVDEFVLSANTAMAIATGNPLILKKVEVDQKVKELEGFKQAHRRNMYKYDTIVSESKEKISGIERNIKITSSQLKQMATFKDSEFSVTIGKKSYTKLSEAGQAIIDATSKNIKKLTTFGEYKGFPLSYQYNELYYTTYVYVGDEDGHRFEVSESAVGTATKLKYTENAIETVNKRQKEYLERIKLDVENAKKVLSTPFKYNNELSDALKEQANINAQLGVNVAEIINEDSVGDFEDDDSANESEAPKESKRKATTDGTRSFKGQRELEKRLTTTGSDKIVRRSDIEKYVSKFLDIPVAHGKFRQHSLGIYKTNAKIIRLKNAKDIEVLMHEVGHYYDSLYSLSEEYEKAFKEYNLTRNNLRLVSINPNASEESIKKWERLTEQAKMRLEEMPLHEMIEALPDMFKVQYEAKELPGEAIAEFFRYLIMNEEHAKSMAPNFYKEFTGKVVKNQDTIDFVRTLQAAIDNYAKQNAETRILSNISTKKKANLGLSFDKFYTGAIEDIHSLDLAVREITGGKKISISNDPYRLAWLHRGWAGKAQTFLEYGIVDEEFNKIGKSFSEILEPVKKNLDGFRAYMVAKRAEELHKRGILTGLEQIDVENILKSPNASFYGSVMDELVRYQNSVMNQLINNGIISKDSADHMREMNKNYVPFYRVIDSFNDKKGVGRGYVAYDPLKTIKGSSRDIIDPLESIIKNTYVFTNMAERNRVGQSLVDLGKTFDGTGKFFDKVPPKMMANSFELSQIKKALESAGADTESLDLSEMATLFMPTGYGKNDNIFTVLREGKAEYYEIFDKELYAALKAMNQDETNFLIKILSIPAKMLRAGATLTPDFVARNPVRDAFSAFTFSKYGFIPVVDSIRGLAHVLKKDDLYYKWMASGGAQSSMASLDRDYLQKNIHELLGMRIEELKTAKGIGSVLMKPIDLLRAMSETMENATRLGEFTKGVKKEGMNEAGIRMAALASRDVTLDFQRQGTHTRQINKVSAFFSATIGGADKMVRTFKERPVETTIRSAMAITIPSVILYLLFSDDDRWKEIPQWEKDTFWIIPLGDTIYRIPKPFEMGLLFGTIPERFLQFVKENDRDAFDGLVERVADTFIPDFIPTAFLPWLEAMTNYSFFKGYNIVPDSQKYLEKWAQFGTYTSDTAKIIGKALNQSPRIIDNTIYGYGAGLGRYGVDILDVVLQLTGLVDKKILPKSEFEDLPVIKGFTVKAYESAKSIDDFYTAKDALQRKKATYDNLTGSETLLQKKYNGLSDELSDLRKEQNRIYDSKSIAPERKTQMIKQITKQMVNVAREALGERPISTK